MHPITHLINTYFQIDCTQPTRHQSIVWPRNISMYLMVKYTNLSYEAIGAEHGRDHSTVNHACKVVEDRMQMYKADRDTVEHLSNCVQLSIDYGFICSAERRYKKRKKPTMKPAPLRKQTKM